MTRRTKDQIKNDRRISEIANAVKGCVVAMKPTEAVAAQAYCALYKDVLIGMLAHKTTAQHLAPEIAVVVQNRMVEAFDNIVSDVQQLVAPVLKSDTFCPPVEQQRDYH